MFPDRMHSRGFSVLWSAAITVSVIALLLVCVSCGGGGGSSSSSSPGDTDRAQAAPFTFVDADATTPLGVLFGYGRDMDLSDASAYLRSRAAGGDVAHGADIGIPVTATVDGQERTFFFFGDTDPLDPDALDSNLIRKDPFADNPLVAAYGINLGDALGVSDDTDPDDGLALSGILRNQEDGGAPVCDAVDPDGVRPLFVPGVHDDPDNFFTADPFGAALSDACKGGLQLNTPTGAFAVGSRLFMVSGVQNSFQDPSLPDRSFLAASEDGGKTWTLLNNGQPLSDTGQGPGGKFIHVGAVSVDLSQIEPSPDAECALPTPPAGEGDRAVYLFGAGTWLTTGVYLGVVFESELEAAAQDPTMPLPVRYYAGPGTCWSPSQDDAVAVIPATEGRHYVRFEQPCGNNIMDTTGGVDYLSLTRITGQDGGEEVDRLVLATTPKYFACVPEDGDPCCGGTLMEDGLCSFPGPDNLTRPVEDVSLGLVLITADPAEPWNWARNDDGTLAFEAVPHPAGAQAEPAGPVCSQGGEFLGGYAPQIVGRFTRANPAGGFDLYLLTSVWNDDYNVNVFRVTIRDGR